MSSLIVKAHRIDSIVPLPNADKLEIAIVGGWQCVVPKNEYTQGELVVYVPPDTVLTDKLAEKLGVTKYLHKGNRVKAIRLRGETSFGLIFRPDVQFSEGDDVAGHYEITKWTPPPPRNLTGTQGRSRPKENHPLWRNYTDLENLRNYKNIIDEGTEVVVLEKIDGCQTSTCMLDGELVVSSRNHNRAFPTKKIKRSLFQRVHNYFSGRYPSSVRDDEAIRNDWWWYSTTVPGVVDLLEFLGKHHEHKQVILYGETFGRVQPRMSYGFSGKLQYRAFDLMIDGKFVDYHEFIEYCKSFNIPTVPEIAIVPYDFDTIKNLANGTTMVNECNQIREGVVVRPLTHMQHPKIGRVAFKFISDNFLLKQYTAEATEDFVDN